MWIVLDSTEFRRAYANLDDADLQALFAAQRSLNVGLAVPQVVLSEILNAIREEALAHAAKADREVREVNAWTRAELPGLSEPTGKAIAAAQARFEEGLRQRGVRILPIPDVPHERLVSRDLARRKPFDEGRGYRDALIWESVLALAKEEPVPVVLVSANRRDFGAEALHGHLAEDLAARGWAAGRVALSRSAKECWDDFVRPRTRPMDEAVGMRLESLVAPGEIERLQRGALAQFDAARVAHGPVAKPGYLLQLWRPFELPAFGPIRSATEYPDGTRLILCPGTFRTLCLFAGTRRQALPAVEREVHGTFTTRIALPPGGPPHVRADEFRLVGERDLSPEAQAYAERAWKETQEQLEIEEEHLRRLEAGEVDG
jgi:PIN domain